MPWKRLIVVTVVIKRENRRYLIKLPVEVDSGAEVIRGTTVRISRKGVFVRSQRSFSVGTPVGIALHLTDERVSRLKGIVKYARLMTALQRQNGMGIEFTALDTSYLEFITSVERDKG